VVERSTDEHRDGEGLVTAVETFLCGCSTLRTEYHDGSVRERTQHHGGRKVADELYADH